MSDVEPFVHGEECTHIWPDEAFYKKHGHRWYEECGCTVPESPDTERANIAMTCGSLDCPERTGGKCNALDTIAQQNMSDAVDQDVSAVSGEAPESPETSKQPAGADVSAQQNAGELEDGPSNGLMDATLHDIVWAGTQFSTIREVLCKDEQESAIEALIARRELAAVEQAKQIIVDLTDEDDCQYDHHGYCQAHCWMATEPTCPHKRAKEFFNQFKEEMK